MCLSNQAEEFGPEWVGAKETQGFGWRSDHLAPSESSDHTQELEKRSVRFCGYNLWTFTGKMRFLGCSCLLISPSSLRSVPGRGQGGPKPASREAHERGFRPSCSEPPLGRSLPASTTSWSSYLGWSHARPGQGGGSRPPRAACRPGTSGSSPASGPSLLLCRPGTLVDTCGEEVQDWQEVGRRPEKSPQCKKPSESGIGFHYGSVLCSGPWLKSSREVNSSLWFSQLGGLA